MSVTSLLFVVLLAANGSDPDRQTLVASVVTQWSDWTFGGERTGTGASIDVRLQFLNFWGLVVQSERHLAATSPDELRGGPALQTPGSTRTRVIFHLDPRRAVNLRLDGSRTVEVVADPAAARFERRFRRVPDDAMRHDPDEGRYHVDVDGDGTEDLSFPDPGFTYGQLSSNVVLRWEYRPGSTLFVAWSRDAFDRRGAGSLYPLEGVSDLVGFGIGPRVPATNTLLLKLTFLLGS